MSFKSQFNARRLRPSPTGSGLRQSHFAVLASVLTALAVASHGDQTKPDTTYSPAAPFIVEVYGQDPPTGRHILLVPGLGNPGSVWDATVDALATDGHRLHVFTLAGFAGHPAIEGELLPQVRDALAAYAQSLDKPAVIGHSLGGTLAFWLAATEPNALGPIIAVDGVPFLPALMDPTATLATARASAEQYRDMLSKMTVETYDQQTAFTLSTMITDPAEARRIAEASRGSNPDTIASAVHDLMTRDLRDAIVAIKSPVLLIAAGAVAPTDEAAVGLRQRYAAQVAAVPNHRLEVVPGARHFVMLDTPQRFLELVREHLAVDGDRGMTRAEQ